MYYLYLSVIIVHNNEIYTLKKRIGLKRKRDNSYSKWDTIYFEVKILFEK